MRLENLAKRLRLTGPRATSDHVAHVLKRTIATRYGLWRHAGALEYQSPNDLELLEIEAAIVRRGLTVADLELEASEFLSFCADNWFPDNYFAGVEASVRSEKLLEHWLALTLLGLEDFGPDDIYIDVAASGSPWARELRSRLGMQAYAIDLAETPLEFANLEYYRQEDATATMFAVDSVRAASLQCAFEMFRSNDDQLLVKELARILKPGGKALIAPLYLHIENCCYASPEYYGRGFNEPEYMEFIRRDIQGIPSSRKYDAETLATRILLQIGQSGLDYRILILREKEAFGTGIYCHFILEIKKPDVVTED